MDVLILRYEAPAMSFGGARIDEVGRTLRFPPTSQVVGLIGNALGFDRLHHERLAELQDRMLVATRIDRTGSTAFDYQTVRLDQVLGHDKYRLPEEIAEDPKKKVTHIRHREFIQDGVITLAVTLGSGDGPDLTDCALALHAPARPLFLGRAGFIPCGPLVIETMDAGTLDGALSIVPRAAGADAGPLPAMWPPMEGSRSGKQVYVPGDHRDWANGVSVGRNAYVLGHLSPPPAVEDTP